MNTGALAEKNPDHVPTVPPPEEREPEYAPVAGLTVGPVIVEVADVAHFTHDAREIPRVVNKRVMTIVARGDLESRAACVALAAAIDSLGRTYFQ